MPVALTAISSYSMAGYFSADLQLLQQLFPHHKQPRRIRSIPLLA